MENQDQLTAYLDAKEAFLDNFIGKGSDQELFVTSYIYGHFSVVAAKTMQHIGLFDDAEQGVMFFVEHLQESVDSAIENGELDGQDASDVKDMLLQVLSEAS